MSSVPHVLMGLHNIFPADAMRAALDGKVAPLDQGTIKQTLRNAAINIYNHEKASTRYSHRLHDSRYAVSLLLCALHGQDAPDIQQTMELSRFSKAIWLPLEYWQGLYVALIAEIRLLYADIEQHFDTQLEGGKVFLHHCGWDGRTENAPLNILDFVSQLEELWLLLTDDRLIGYLEYAVRRQNAGENWRLEVGDEVFAAQFETEWNKLGSEELSLALEDYEGILEPMAKSPVELIDTLWQQHIPRIYQACHKDFGIALSMNVQQAQPPESPAPMEGNLDLKHDVTRGVQSCSCQVSCQCWLVCQFEVSTCACQEIRNSVQDQAPHQHNTNEHIQPDLDGHNATSDTTLHSVTNNVTQMQVAIAASPQDPYMVHAAISARQTTNITEAQLSQQTRQRSDTADSHLAYVPMKPPLPRTPSRKDAYPLDFYGYQSGGRYPKFQPGTDKPARKPVPGSPLLPPALPPRTAPDTTSSTWTPPSIQYSNSSSAVKVSHRPGDSSYTSIPPPATSGLTQSFPVPERGNPRQPDEFSTWDTSHVETPVSAIEGKKAGASDKLGPIRHSADSPSPSLRGNMAVGDPNPQSQPGALPPSEAPQLPLPDFIAPRPAMRQRYVSAGGTQRLEDRAEIPGFALPQALDPGLSMVKEEFLKKAAEMVVPPSRRDSGFITPRPSQDSARGSKRNSKEIEVPSKEKRNRTSSSFSNKGLLKRILSRTSNTPDG